VARVARVDIFHANDPRGHPDGMDALPRAKGSGARVADLRVPATGRAGEQAVTAACSRSSTVAAPTCFVHGAPKHAPSRARFQPKRCAGCSPRAPNSSARRKTRLLPSTAAPTLRCHFFQHLAASPVVQASAMSVRLLTRSYRVAPERPLAPAARAARPHAAASCCLRRSSWRCGAAGRERQGDGEGQRDAALGGGHARIEETIAGTAGCVSCSGRPSRVPCHVRSCRASLRRRRRCSAGVRRGVGGGAGSARGRRRRRRRREHAHAAERALCSRHAGSRHSGPAAECPAGYVARHVAAVWHDRLAAPRCRAGAHITRAAVAAAVAAGGNGRAPTRCTAAGGAGSART